MTVTKETVSDAALKAAVNRAMLGFLRAHRNEISPCEANQQLLLDTIQKLVLPVDSAESFEIAYLKLEGKLAPAQIELEPEPAPEPVELQATPEKENMHDWSKERLRAFLKEQSAITIERVPTKKVLPQSLELWNSTLRRADTVQLTADNLRKLDGKMWRDLTDKYGLAAIQARLDGVA
jgi:hypothetical protein